jgi:hypothetical protein
LLGAYFHVDANGLEDYILSAWHEGEGVHAGGCIRYRPPVMVFTEGGVASAHCNFAGEWDAMDGSAPSADA